LHLPGGRAWQLRTASIEQQLHAILLADGLALTSCGEAAPGSRRSPILRSVRVGILGAAEARLNGAAVDLGTRKQRALLAALAMHRGRPVPADTLVDLLWGEAPPAAVTATLQGYVARLRRALEPDRPPRSPSEVLVTQQGGYALVLPDDALDAACFEASVAAAHERLGTVAAAESLPQPELQALFDSLSSALGLWRGLPYTELEESPAAQAERSRLEELRATALEDRAVAGLGLGRHAMVAGELEVLTATYPLRERLWGLRALALTRSGRQADALEVLRQVRELLSEELGLEPGAELRELQTAVLRQDPGLAWTARDSGETTSEAPRTPTRSTPRGPAGFAWPLVGRDDELGALVGLLERSEEQPVFAVLTGEPGIGKSRLCAELAAHAQSEGVTVLVGRCSQDEGAPPLYPWASVLRDLGHDLPSDPGEDDRDDTASRFRAWEAIARTLAEEAAERHLLVLLDDLHWADTSTLRVLRLLAETVESGRLMVVATWRPQPPPTGQLAELAETLARRHALRVELHGLTADEAAEVVSSVAEAAPTTTEADALRARTDGNPFFLVEYARLAREGGDLTALLAEEHPPAAVQDVLTRRLAALPDDTARALRFACVVGRHFDVATLARGLDLDEDDVLDALDPALAAGLVREFGVDRFRFAHALVRDTAYAALSRSRRGRMHARVAEVMADQGNRDSEVARHWLEAGPQHAAQAWRAASAAAEAARRLYAYDEAVELRRAALGAGEQDPELTLADRYELFVGLAVALQLAGNWIELRSVVRQALRVADELDDLERLLRAATMLSTNALWQPGGFGDIDDEVIAMLRSVLDRLPPGDSPMRCRAMVSIASETFYASTRQERWALCEEAIAMARRLHDPKLLLWALLTSVLPIWRPASAFQRVQMTEVAMALARQLGDGIALSTAMVQHATARSELGRVDGLLDLVSRAREQAQEQRHLFAHLVLDGLEISWRAMRGELDLVDVLLGDMAALHERLEVEQSGDALIGAVLMKMIWGGQMEVLVEQMGELEGVTVIPPEAAVAAMLCRVGRVDDAREYLEDKTIELTGDWWFSSMVSAMAAEAAAYTGRTDIAAGAYASLSPMHGQPACAGSGSCVGPVDAFLAMAAWATGERDLATRHADDAARLCEEWEVPLAAQWFAGVRETFGF
jgi:DNA-binding SARP family transcriptional activator